MKRLVVCLSVVFTLSLSANTFIEPSIDPMWSLPMPQDQDDVDPTAKNNAYDFSGIIKLSNCSASLIRFEGDNELNQPAMMLTNGHCIGMGRRFVLGTYMPAYGEVITNKEAVRTASIYGTNGIVGVTKTNKILYATMTDTDMAIYTLELTYAQIKEMYNVEPLILSSNKPEVETPIEIISGYWNRGYSCSMAAEIFMMLEDEWFWKNSIKYSQPGCETIGGTSGSPILNKNTREVVGVNNTGFEGGEPCSLMNPCEIDEDGNITTENGASYGQQTYLVYACLTQDFKLDLDKEECLLPKN